MSPDEMELFESVGDDLARIARYTERLAVAFEKIAELAEKTHPPENRIPPDTQQYGGT